MGNWHLNLLFVSGQQSCCCTEGVSFLKAITPSPSPVAMQSVRWRRGQKPALGCMVSLLIAELESKGAQTAIQSGLPSRWEVPRGHGWQGHPLTTCPRSVCLRYAEHCSRRHRNFCGAAQGWQTGKWQSEEWRRSCGGLFLGWGSYCDKWIIRNESNKDSVVNLTEKLYPSGYVLCFENKLKNKPILSLIHLLCLPGKKIQTLQVLFSHFHVTCLYESWDYDSPCYPCSLRNFQKYRLSVDFFFFSASSKTSLGRDERSRLMPASW